MQSSAQELLKRMSDAWWSQDRWRRGRSYRCRCGRTIFFDGRECLGSGAPLGYDPLLGEIHALEIGPSEGTWRLSGAKMTSLVYRRCGNFETPARCNWLVPVDDELSHCMSCRLNRAIPDQIDVDNRRYWTAIEKAKRRLVSQLLAIGVPVKSKVSEDPEFGLASICCARRRPALV